MPINPFVEYRKPVVPKELLSIDEFLKYLEMSAKELRLISVRRYAQYKILTIPKRSGGLRTISSPNARLKFLQRKIYDKLSVLYHPKWCVQGFVPGRSALTNAQRHLGRPFLVKIDLDNYFDQVTPPRIKGVLRYFGIPAQVSDAVSILCTLGGKLPQGAPTSPILANMVTFKLDQLLMAYSKRNGLRYTRYSDDICLSSYSRPRILKASVASDHAKLRPDDLESGLTEIFAYESFQINEKKLTFCGRNSRRRVTGYTINEFPNVPRQHIRQIRSLLRDIETRGYPLAQIRFAEQTKSIKSLKNSLRGRINWVLTTKGASDPVYRPLAMRFNKLFPSDEMLVGPDRSKLSVLSTWVIEAETAKRKSPKAQGTVFFLVGVGLVTAAHCLPPNCKYKVFCVDHPAEVYEVTVAKQHNHIDLAVLNHTIPKDKYIELKLASREPNVGEEVNSWGFPAFGPGKHVTVKGGKISSKPKISAVEQYAVDFKLYPGTSGGPILNSAYEVIGVVHKGGDGEAYDLAAKAKYFSQI